LKKIIFAKIAVYQALIRIITIFVPVLTVQPIGFFLQLCKKKNNMKNFILLLIALTGGFMGFAQSYETKAEYNKSQQPAILCEFAYAPGLVENAITEELKQKGFGKGKSTKGYTLYQAINFTEISSEKIDFYLLVDKKSRKEKDIAIVTILVSKGYDNFMSGTSDPSVLQNVMTYVNGLKEKLEKISLEMQITDQEVSLKKEQKKYDGLVDDAADLEKKRRKIEQDIEDNKKEQEKQKAEAEKQRQILEALKAKRKV
jgi:predicted RNA-binding protein with RPS1 domain